MSRDVTDIQVLADFAYFELEVYKYFWTYQGFMWWIILNILGQNISKIRQEIFWTYQVFICWIVLNIF